MKHYVIAAITLAALTACGQKQSTEAAVEETAPVERVSGIDIGAMDKSVRPGDDFFMFMNGAWIEETEIPADKSSYGGFTVLRDESTENVKAIIEESTTGHFAKGSDEQKVGDLYKSYMDMETRNAKGISPLQPELDRIDAIESYDDLAAHFGSVVRRGLDAPFAVFQFADFKIPTHYGVYAAQSGLGLPDREFYFNEDDKSVEIRREYVAQIEKKFELAGFEDATGARQTIGAL